VSCDLEDRNPILQHFASILGRATPTFSNLALQEAIKLATDHHSMLRLFHVVDLTMAYSALEAPYILEYRKAMEAEGRKVVADCAEPVRAAGIEFDSMRSKKRRQPGAPTSLWSALTDAGAFGV
jgi:nucleotide-binding universal stress UspA family protein